MLIMALISWWYTAGWAKMVGRVKARLAATLDFFSVILLAQTLFDPFRQISAGRVNGPVGVQLRAWADRVFSRMVGTVVRSIFIVIGLVSAGAVSLLGLLQLAIWPVIPLVPILAVIALLGGWTPL